MPAIVLGPIYLGWDTASEAAAVAAVYSLFLGFVIYKELTLRKVWEAIGFTTRIMAILFVIVAAAFLLNEAFTYLRVPFTIVDALSGAGFGWASFLIVVILLYMVMGMFLDPAAILMVMGPLLLPVVLNLGISPLTYGVLVAFSVELGVLTPPYGLVLFAAVGILKEDFGFITRSVLLFYPALILGQVLIAYVPQLTLFLVGG